MACYLQITPGDCDAPKWHGAVQTLPAEYLHVCGYRVHVELEKADGVEIEALKLLHTFVSQDLQRIEELIKNLEQ